MSKRDEAIAAENELKTRTKDLDGIKVGGAAAQASRRIDMTPH